MPDDPKSDPLDDVKKGLGLLFRAARTAASRLSSEGAPLEKLEGAVRTGAREVGRAIENVTNTVVGAAARKPDASSPEAAETDAEPKAGDDKSTPPKNPPA